MGIYLLGPIDDIIHLVFRVFIYRRGCSDGAFVAWEGILVAGLCIKSFCWVAARWWVVGCVGVNGDVFTVYELVFGFGKIN